MVELIKLPYRHYGTSTSLDVRLSLKSESGLSGGFGREIQLHPFISGQVNKYKLIEYCGDKIYERIFLMSKDIMPDDIWWRGDEHLVYPIQCKIITGDNCVVGKSFKYTQGILHYLQDYQVSNEIHTPVLSMMNIQSPYTDYIIPHPETDIISYNLNCLNLYTGIYDPWLQNDVNLPEMYPNLKYMDIGMNGLISLALSDVITPAAHCIDIDPIDHNWSMWELIDKLNEIVTTDIVITVYKAYAEYCDAISMDINFHSRYNLIYQNDIQYRMLMNLLKHLVMNMVQEKFSNVKWTKIVIAKSWSEEVTIDVYEAQNPNVISQVLYVDLPIFSLGTFGISSAYSLSSDLSI